MKECHHMRLEKIEVGDSFMITSGPDFGENEYHWEIIKTHENGAYVYRSLRYDDYSGSMGNKCVKSCGKYTISETVREASFENDLQKIVDS